MYDWQLCLKKGSNMPEQLVSDAVHAIPVGKLFNSADRYSIPLYQRNYTWGEEQIHRLVHDIIDEAKNDKTNDYFLGNLVVALPSREDDPFDVIDGQQRLTTLYVLLTKLRKYPETREQSSRLQPLTYEAREKATRALRSVVAGTHEADESEQSAEDSGILQAANIIDQLLDDPEIKKSFAAYDVICYLLNRVKIIRMPIDRGTDLNKYFEIMNTRGVQLSAVDIVKARLMRHLGDSRDRSLLDQVWSACSDMNHYVSMSLTSGDTVKRSAVFGSDWEQLPPADFAELRRQLFGAGSDDSSKSVNTQSFAMTLDDAISTYSQINEVIDVDDAEGDNRFTSQITFPTFLLHALAIRRPESSADRDDRQLDDKLLVSRFSDRLEELQPSQRARWVQDFSTDLLRIRCLFDRFILKRDAALGAGNESSTDEEPGSWSLYRLSRGESVSRGRRSDSPRYLLSFSNDEIGLDAGDVHRKIILLQSALRITYTSPRTMHWITEALRFVVRHADLDQEVTSRDFLNMLENYALGRLEEAMLPDSDKADVGPDGHPLGFGIPRIMFTYLDYLLVDEMNESSFTFSYRTSIEHFSPSMEDVDHASAATHVRDRTLLDWFGNLALVTVSTNSKFSNYSPREKANNRIARAQSLKLELMARRAETSSWNDEDIKAHHEKMMGLLYNALAHRP